MAKRMDLTDWSARVDPVVERYRSLVALIGQEEAALAMSAVGRMILAVEKARAAGSQSSVSIAEDAIVQAGKLLEAMGGQSRRDQP
jgi:hypothetical protein